MVLSEVLFTYDTYSSKYGITIKAITNLDDKDLWKSSRKVDIQAKIQRNPRKILKNYSDGRPSLSLTAYRQPGIVKLIKKDFFVDVHLVSHQKTELLPSVLIGHAFLEYRNGACP